MSGFSRDSLKRHLQHPSRYPCRRDMQVRRRSRHSRSRSRDSSPNHRRRNRDNYSRRHDSREDVRSCAVQRHPSRRSPDERSSPVYRGRRHEPQRFSRDSERDNHGGGREFCSERDHGKRRRDRDFEQNQPNSGDSVIASSEVTNSEVSDFKQVVADIEPITDLDHCTRPPINDQGRSSLENSVSPSDKMSVREEKEGSESSDSRQQKRDDNPSERAPALVKTGNSRADKFIRLLGHGRTAKSSEKEQENLNALLTGGGNQRVNQMQQQLESQFMQSLGRNAGRKTGLGLI